MSEVSGKGDFHFQLKNEVHNENKILQVMLCETDNNRALSRKKENPLLSSEIRMRCREGDPNFTRLCWLYYGFTLV